MSARYKIIISNRNFYKEIEIPEHIESLSVGTGIVCDVRLHKDMFFGQLELSFTRSEDDSWSVICSDNLYITVGDVRKLVTKRLKHGDEFKVKYQDTDNDVFDVEFMIDFEYEQKSYNLAIDISGRRELRIGGDSFADIAIDDRYIGNDCLIIKRGSNLSIVDARTKYGVYVNGAKINGEQKLKNMDFFSMGAYSFYYNDGTLYTTGSDNLTVSSDLRVSRVEEHSTVYKYPKFRRNTRVQFVVPEDELEIQQPVQKPQAPKKNIVMTLIPTIVMLAMTILLRGILGGGGMFVIYSAVSMSIGVVMSIISYRQDKKEYAQEIKKREESYQEYLDSKIDLIQESRQNELRINKLIYESLDNSIDEVNSFGRRLFERSLGDKDFLHVYLGQGRIESQNQVKFTKQEFANPEDPLSMMPERIHDEYRYIEDAPIISDFYASCGIGVVGTHDSLVEMMKNMTLDLAIRHFYGDLRMSYIFSNDFADRFQWIRWLRNVYNDQLDLRNIVCDEESKNILLDNFYSILSGRENMLSEKKDIVFPVQYVVFVTDSSLISTHPISKYIISSKAYGFTFVFFEEHEECLPQGCSEIIRLSSQPNGEAIKTMNGDIVTSFRYPVINDRTAQSIAIKLGSVDVDEVNLEGQLTKNISMFNLLDIMSVEDLDLTERWKASAVDKCMAAPIGVKTKNEIVYLDIGDNSSAHGPHGLVAGTTGSGKSEILQTYILSIATLFHPYEVGFVIIDFKGGGMANQFRNLPHLIGTITNIDGREINRSLLSIKAELVKRQEIFSENGVNHINDYIRLYKAKKVDTPLPHLIIIVDEFAELKAEHPDFMKELISAARIGRTLGIHLILATQKPAGVVDAQIWSNSRFKLCLKVQTKEDSNEVLKTPLAAEIVEPGRAYFQVGNNEIFELFQSAYSGAKVPAANESNEKVFEIYESNFWGKKTKIYTNKKEKEKTETATQLQAIVNYVREYCDNNGIYGLPGICLPSLPDVLKVSSFDYSSDDEDNIISVPIGMYDDPEQQDQGTVIAELSRENTFIVGSAQMGKTVLLQTILYGLITKYTPEQVNIYIVDCGSMVLKMFEDSVHVGGVVISNEEEKCKNLFKLLNSTIAQRKKALSSKGVGNFAAYLDAGYTDMPMIAVIIDNMAAFKEYFPDQTDELNSLSREAQSVGISFVITAATSNALSYRTQANFGKKLVLNSNDPAEYSNVFGHCKMTPKEITGRGLFMKDKRVLEFQVGMFGKSHKEAERSMEIKQFIAERNSRFSKRALQIPMIPENLNLDNIISNNIERFREKGVVVVGMDYSTVDFVSINLNNTGSFALIGEQECKERFLNNMMDTINRTAIFHNIEATVLDDKNRKLKNADNMGFVKYYSCDTANSLELLDKFCDLVEDRSDEDQLNDFQMLVVFGQDIMKQLNLDKKLCKRLAETIRAALDGKALVILGNLENQSIGFNSSEVLKVVKDERNGIIFAPITECKFYDVSGRPRSDTSFDGTMGYRFEGNTYSKIKIFD